MIILCMGQGGFFVFFGLKGGIARGCKYACLRGGETICIYYLIVSNKRGEF